MVKHGTDLLVPVDEAMVSSVMYILLIVLTSFQSGVQRI